MTSPIAPRIKRTNAKKKHEIPVFKLVNLTPKESRVNRNKLLSFYEKNNQFPNEYRPLIWRFLLKLPENNQAFSDLANRGIHSTYEKELYQRFPLQSDRLFNKLLSLCSMFAHWSPIFAEVSYTDLYILCYLRLHFSYSHIRLLFNAYCTIHSLTLYDNIG